MDLQAPRGRTLPRRAAGDRGRRGRLADRGAGQEHRLAGPAQPRPHRERRRRIGRYGADHHVCRVWRSAERARLFHREDRAGRDRQERSRPARPRSGRLGSLQAGELRARPPHRGGEEPRLLHRRLPHLDGWRSWCSRTPPRRWPPSSPARSTSRSRCRRRTSTGSAPRPASPDSGRPPGVHRRGHGQRPQAVQRSPGPRGALPHPGPPGHDRSRGRRLRHPR